MGPSSLASISKSTGPPKTAALLPHVIDCPLQEWSASCVFSKQVSMGTQSTVLPSSPLRFRIRILFVFSRSSFPAARYNSQPQKWTDPRNRRSTPRPSTLNFLITDGRRPVKILLARHTHFFYVSWSLTHRNCAIGTI